MGTFTAVPGLDELVAQMVAPDVRDIAKKVELEAKKRAPAMKKWVTMADNAVRHTHAQTHGQEVPENLRFEVPSMQWDMEHRGVGPITYMMKPKDESSGAVANLKNCRCTEALLPTAIAEKIRTGPAEVTDAVVRVVVSCTAVKIVECEVGDYYPRGNHSEGTHFMAKAVAAVARAAD